MAVKTNVGSTPAASTSLRQGFGRQAGVLAKAARHSSNERRRANHSPQNNSSNLGRFISCYTASNSKFPTNKMRYVYLIRSIQYPKQKYIGVTSDVKSRLNAHNEGKSSHTSKFKPWELISYIAFSDTSQAADFELYLKSGSGRAFANKRLW